MSSSQSPAPTCVRLKNRSAITSSGAQRCPPDLQAHEALWATYHQTYFWAATDLWLAARSNERLARALAPREQAWGATIRSAIDEMFGPALAARPAYPSLREVLNTSMHGVALTCAFDPRDPWLDPHLSTWKALARRELEVPS